MTSSRPFATAILFSLSVALAGCGAETVGTAAVVGQGKVQEAERAEQLKQDVLDRIDAAQAEQARKLQEAAEATR